MIVTPWNAQHAASLLKALAEKRTIQHSKNGGTCGPWVDCVLAEGHIIKIDDPGEFRVKPLEFWINTKTMLAYEAEGPGRIKVSEVLP